MPIIELTVRLPLVSDHRISKGLISKSASGSNKLADRWHGESKEDGGVLRYQPGGSLSVSVAVLRYAKSD